MGKRWPLGPDDEPTGWLQAPTYEVEPESAASDQVASTFDHEWPIWGRLAVLGWIAGAFVGFVCMGSPSWTTFSILFVIACWSSYVTFRAARANVDDELRDGLRRAPVGGHEVLKPPYRNTKRPSYSGTLSWLFLLTTFAYYVTHIAWLPWWLFFAACIVWSITFWANFELKHQERLREIDSIFRRRQM